MVLLRPSVGLLLVVGLASATPAAFAEGRTSRLEKITIGTAADADGAMEVIVRVLGTRTPDLTSFTLQEPRRVVLDWAGSELGPNVQDRRFRTGLVRGIRTHQFASEAEQVSRVTIELSRHVSYKLETKGDAVLVRFRGDEIPAVLGLIDNGQAISERETLLRELYAQPVPEGPLTEPAKPPRGEVAGYRARAVPKAVTVGSLPRAVEIPVAPEVAARPERLELTQDRERIESTPQRKIVAVPRRGVVAESPAPPSGAPAVAVKVKVKDGNPVAVLSPEVPRSSDTAASAGAILDEPVVRPGIPVPEVSAPVLRPEPLKPVPEASAPVELEAVPEVAAVAPKPPERVPAEEEAGYGGGAGSAALPPPDLPPPDLPPPTALASAESQALAAAQVPSVSKAAVASKGARATLRYVGFRMKGARSLVFVRCTGKPRYDVRIVGPKRVELQLYDTGIALKNNMNALDTSFFPSAVLRVKASETSFGASVIVDLREEVPFEARRFGSQVQLIFDSPSS